MAGVRGIDVSNVNGHVDWAAVAAAGPQYAFLKATEGISFTDKRFAAHREEAKAAGLRVGFYHYARPDLHPHGAAAEAAHFAHVVGTIGPGELRPVLDLETPAGISPAEMTTWAGTFLAELERLTGIRPIFYTYPDFIASRMGHAQSLGGYPLWLASYGPNDGREHPFTIPSLAWRSAVVHQFSSRGRNPGISGFVDMNSAPELAGLFARPAHKNPVTAPIWPVPLPAWFWDWAKWRRAGADPAERPGSAPRLIMPWAWARLRALNQAAGAAPASTGAANGGVLRGPMPDVTPAQLIALLANAGAATSTFTVSHLASGQQHAVLAVSAALGAILIVGDSRLRGNRAIAQALIAAAKAQAAPVVQQPALHPGGMLPAIAPPP
jgi:lysozyme